MKAASNAFWLTACRLSGDVLNLLLFVLLSRQFGPEGVGEYSYGFAIATFVFVIGCLGVEEYGIRQYARIEPQRQPAFLTELLGAQTVTVLLALAGLVVYILVTAPTTQKLLVILELTCYQTAAALSLAYFIPKMANQRMVIPAVAELISRIVAFTVAGVAIYAMHASLTVALIGFPLAAVLWVAMAVRSLRSSGPIRIAVTQEGLRRIGGIIWSFALIEIFAQLFARVGVIVLSLAVSDAAAGLFATGLRLVETALVPLAFFGIAHYPQLSRLFTTDPPSFRQTAVQMIWFMVLAGLLVGWGLYFVAPDLLVPVLGERFAATAPYVRLMAGLAFVQALEAGLGRVLLSADLQVRRAIFIAVAAGVSLVLNVTLAPSFGVAGAIVSVITAYMAINVLSLVALRPSLTGPLLAPLLVTVVVAILLSVAVVAGLSWGGFGYWVQAAAALGVLALVSGAGYSQRFGTHAAPSDPAPTP